MNITKGRIPGAKKVVIYGVEGIGKSTLAAQFPNPVFIDTEGSTKELDVARFDSPTSWPMLLAQVQYIIDNPSTCQTLVLDTADWAEQIMIRHICAQKHWTGLEDPGYGKGYQYAAEEWGGQLLNRLSEVAERGVNVVVTAHAWLRKVDLPEENASYDHWEMKTSKKVAPMLREWADCVLFLHYETIVVKNENKKAKAQGGRRVIETNHTPFWDAKNRFGLPDKLPLDFSQLAGLFQNQSTAPAQPVVKDSYPVISEPDPDLPFSGPSGPKEEKPTYIPQPLWDLMQANSVTEEDIQNAVGNKGYYPVDTPIENYHPDFITGCLIGAWDQVYQLIQQNRKENA